MMKQNTTNIYKLIFMVVVCFLYQCKNKKAKHLDQKEIVMNTKPYIKKTKYGIINGVQVDNYLLKNKNKIEVNIINYGGIITSIKVPDKNGKFENIVLGYDSLPEYIENKPYLGAIIGRYANRIANGKFSIDGIEYTLAKNAGENNLHGGIKGFDKKVWKANTKSDENSVSLILSYLSKDMEEGFPGNLNTKVTYTLKNDNKIEIYYEASTDKKTIVNLTNHSYFNLSGNFKNTILDHKLQIKADKMLPVNELIIPTGRIENVKNTPFDFKTFKEVGQDIKSENDQLKRGSGYDHCWVLNDQNKGLRYIAAVYHEKSGRILEVFSDKPGVQFYTGNHLNGKYQKRTGLCLETQYYPDSPNQPKFTSVIIDKDKKYTSKTVFKFSVK